MISSFIRGGGETTSSSFSSSSLQHQIRSYRQGPNATSKTTVGGYRPPMISKDEHPYDDRVEELEDVKKNDPDRKFLLLHRKEKWDREVKAKESSTKRGGRSFQPQKNKNKYKRAMKKQMFIMENNGERKRNTMRKYLAERPKVEEHWRMMKRFAKDPDLLTLVQCESCKKTYPKYEEECKKCSEKNEEDNAMSGL
jgi:hypothetical protein